MTTTPIWFNNTHKPLFPLYEGTREVHTAVIGGGLAGILTSYLLTVNGIDNILLEAGDIGGCTTGHTTAKITAGHNLIYKNISDSYGIENARKYAASNLKAIKDYNNIIAKENIDCDFEKQDNYIYAMSAENAKNIEDEYRTLKKLGVPCSKESTLSLPFSVKNAIKMPDQASFHPLKFLYHISKDLNIYENSKVLSIDINTNTIQTAKGALYARKIIICTHFPFINTPGYFFLKMYQQRSYVMAIKCPADFSGMYIDASEQGHSFRAYKNHLFIGGSSHRCGHNEDGFAYKNLEKYIKKLYPGSSILYKWSAQDCMSLDNIPYIGHFSKKYPDILVATGFKKWGMTTSMVASNILRDLVLDKKNEFEELYSPNRFEIMPSAKNLLSNVKDAAKGLTIEHLTSGNPTCPHLGCKLTFNPDEESWDCPCHGSRFDKTGKILSNPSQDPLLILG